VTDSALSELLLMLEAEWLRLRAPLAGRLRPGLGPAEVHAKVAALGLTAPDDLVTFFGWHDGADGSDVYEQKMFVDDLRLVTLDEAIEETRSQRELSSQVSTPPAFVLWPEPWVLLCRGRGGQELALDCSPGQASLPFLLEGSGPGRGQYVRR